MPSIWSPQARKVLLELRRKRVLLAFDFDGTLVPHFPAPNPVVVTPETFKVLRLLNDHLPLAIVTGRSVADISQFLDPKEFLIVGNYGCETPWITDVQKKKMHAKAALVRKSFEDFLEHHGLLHRVFVEDKAHSLSLHSKDMKLLRWIDKLVRQATRKELRPHRRQFGIGTLNIFPEGAPNKGDAVLEIMRRKQCTHAIFAGDDLPDEDVFELTKQVTGVRVGYRKNTHAKFHVKSQEEMDEFLALMVSVFVDQNSVTLSRPFGRPSIHPHSGAGYSG